MMEAPAEPIILTPRAVPFQPLKVPNNRNAYSIVCGCLKGMLKSGDEYGVHCFEN
jgi:hypothetical protein